MLRTYFQLLITLYTLIRINTEKGKATIDFTANVTLKAHYNMDGQVLILPIRGNGAARIRISEYRSMLY